MRRTLLTATLTLGLLAGTAEARPTVVLFDIEDQTRRIKRNDLKTLHQLLAGKLVERQRVQVVPHGVLRATLAKKRRWRCVDWKCQEMVAHELKAHYVMATKILRLGKKCLVMGSIYNMKTSLLQRSASIKAGCTLEALVAVMERLPARLAPGKLRITKMPARKPIKKAAVRKAPARKPVKKAAVRKAPARKPVWSRVSKIRKKKAMKKAAARKKKPVKKAAAPAFDEPGIGTAHKVPKASAKPAAVAVKEPPPSRRRAMPMWPAIAAAGVGVVGLSIGIPFIALDGTGHSCAGPDEPGYANCEQLWDTGTVGWIFTGLGLGALATSGVLFYFHYFGKKERRAASLPSLTITPTANGGLYVGAGGRF